MSAPFPPAARPPFAPLTDAAPGAARHATGKVSGRLAALVHGRSAGALLATGLYALLTLLMARDLLAGFGRVIPVTTQRNLENDALLNLWVVTWATHTLTTDPLNLFNGNIFYPERLTLAFTDHQLGVVPLFAPLWALFGSPAAGYGAYYLLSFVLTGLATFALVRYWVASLPAALLAGVAFGFALPRLAIHYNTQLLAIWWIPLTLLLTERLLRRPTLGRGLLAALSYAGQWLCAIYPSWHLTAALAIYLLAALVAEPRVFGRGFWRAALPSAAVAALIVVPSLLPYRFVSERWSFEWPIQHLITHSALPIGFLNVSPGNLVYGRLLRDVGGPVGTPQQLFLGLSPLLLTLVALLAYRRPAAPAADQPRERRWLCFTFLAIGLISLLLSFGPYLPTSPPTPSPYLLLMQAVPGFQVMRNPVRFVFLVSLALAVLGGLGAAVLLERVRSPARRATLGGALVLLVSLESFTTLSFEPLPDPDAAAQAELRATADDGPIVELPANWEGGAAQSPRMVASIDHWRPIVGGFSGFKPPRDAFESVLEGAEPRVVADMLRTYGIRTVVIHRDELQPAERERLGSREWPLAGFVERFRDERTLIWSLGPGPAPTRTEIYRVDLQAPRQVAAGATVSLRLLFQVDDGTIYRDEVGGASPVEVEWRPLDRPAEPLRQTVRAALPAVVVPKPRVKAELDASAPGRPGRYRLIVSTARFEVDREVVVSGGRSG